MAEHPDVDDRKESGRARGCKSCLIFFMPPRDVRSLVTTERSDSDAPSDIRTAGARTQYCPPSTSPIDEAKWKDQDGKGLISVAAAIIFGPHSRLFLYDLDTDILPGIKLGSVLRDIEQPESSTLCQRILPRCQAPVFPYQSLALFFRTDLPRCPYLSLSNSSHHKKAEQLRTNSRRQGQMVRRTPLQQSSEQKRKSDGDPNLIKTYGLTRASL